MLFDLDGVLARHDTFSEFVRRQVLRRPWLALPVGGTLPALVATALVPTWQGRPASWAARSAMLGGQVAELSEDLGALGSELAALPRWRVQAALDQAQEHVGSGDRVLVVTASERHLARAFLDGLGLETVELLASELQQTSSGCRLSPHNHGAEKARRVAEVASPPWDLVYSDSLADLPMMRLAHDVVLVNADDRARRTAARSCASVRMERWP